MPTKTANINMRIEKERKEESEALFKTLGITLPQAINMFISQSLLVGGLPFEPKLPRYNKETEAAIKEARDIMSGKSKGKAYSSVSDFISDMEK